MRITSDQSGDDMDNEIEERISKIYVTRDELKKKIEDVSAYVQRCKISDEYDIGLRRKYYKHRYCWNCNGPLYGQVDVENEECTAEIWNEKELQKIKSMMIENGFDGKILLNGRRTPKKYGYY